MSSRKGRRGGAGDGWGKGARKAQPAAAAATYQAGASGDSKYVRLVSDIDSNLRLLGKANAAIEAATSRIGTAKDSKNLRKDTLKRVEDARQLLSSVLGQIRDELTALISAEAASGGGGSRQQQKDKFARLANQHGKRLASATAAFNKANKRTSPPADSGTGATAAKLPASAAASARDEEAGLLGGTAESAQAMVDATASSLIREREQEAAEIAREMTEVADIMKDIAELTEEQDEGFVKLESNAAAAEAAAAAGNKHLDSAAKQQAAYRRKLLIFVAVIVLAAAGITLYFVMGKK